MNITETVVCFRVRKSRKFQQLKDLDNMKVITVDSENKCNT